MFFFLGLVKGCSFLKRLLQL